MTFSDHDITANTLDTLMQDTWLLALTVRNGQFITIDDALYQRCFTMIQQVQDQLHAVNAPDTLCEEIKFAHSVFLDELIMTIPHADISVWWRRTPLQGHFLGHLNGGEYFYDRIKKLLHDPSPAKAIVTCYYRILHFGYAGKYLTEDNEERVLLIQQLKALLPEFSEQQDHKAVVICTGGNVAQWWRLPQTILASLLLLAAGMWAGLRFFLLAQ